MSKNEPIGTTHANYAPASAGPFRCGGCLHYKGNPINLGLCDHPDVAEDARDGEIKVNKEGKPIVEANGCCTYFRN